MNVSYRLPLLVMPVAATLRLLCQNFRSFPAKFIRESQEY
jgi:hypothetical protein